MAFLKSSREITVISGIIFYRLAMTTLPTKYTQLVFTRFEVAGTAGTVRYYSKRRCIFRLLLLLPDPFREMRALRKTMKPQKPGNSTGPGTEVVERQRVATERAAQRQ